MYGKGRWRKLKGIARVRLRTGRVRLAELHWYEAHGIRVIDESGEDYLYSADRFIPIEVPKPLERIHECRSHEPAIELADNYGLKRKQLSEVRRIIGERKDEIIDAWKKHLGS